MFIPSLNGFHFPNAFASGPAIELRLPWLGPVWSLNASFGLCGGMVFSALDYWYDLRPVPPATDTPEAGSPLYAYLTRRLRDSFDLPWGVLRWWWHSGVDDPDWRSEVAAARIAPERCPIPLGLVFAHSWNPRELVRNHTVLLYSVEDNKFRVYDPNHPDDNEVTISFSDTGITHSLAGPVRSLLVLNYEWRQP